MNQSAVIFGYLFVAFLVFITMKGELPVYAGFLLSTPTPAPATVKTSAGVSNILTAASTLALVP